MIQLIITICFILIIIVIFCLSYVQLTNNFYGPYVLADSASLEHYHDKIKIFEKKLNTRYPLGSDFFTISHGNNYYNFFKKIGDVNMLICTDKDDNVIATMVFISRWINGNLANKPEYVWYICDLKVAPAYRGQNITIQMLASQYFRGLTESKKYYGIVMNSNDGKENSVMRLVKENNYLKFRIGGILYIYSLDYDDMVTAKNIMTKSTQLSYVSNSGIKDLILNSTNKPMNILHVSFKNRFNSDIQKISQPKKNYTHMFCLLSTDPNIKKLEKHGIKTNTTATIIHYGMDDYNWEFIETSQI